MTAPTAATLLADLRATRDRDLVFEVVESDARVLRAGGEDHQ